MSARILAIEDDREGEAGFTLVELLVALALFGLLSTLLFGNVRFGLTAWQRGSVHAEQLDHGVMAQSFLRRMIGEAYPQFVREDATHARVEFDGTRDLLKFLADAPIVMGSGGRFRFALSLDRHDGQADLVVNAKPELADPQDRTRSTKNALLTDVDRVEFSYFGIVPSERAAQWHDIWVERADMPELVRLRVAFRAGDTRLWPDLVVAPRIAADVGCVLDPLTRRCRGR
jgi:general secretion pathway protein J